MLARTDFDYTLSNSEGSSRADFYGLRQVGRLITAKSATGQWKALHGAMKPC